MPTATEIYREVKAKIDNNGSKFAHCYNGTNIAMLEVKIQPIVALCGYVKINPQGFVSNPTKPKCPECVMLYQMDRQFD